MPLNPNATDFVSQVPRQLPSPQAAASHEPESPAPKCRVAGVTNRKAQYQGYLERRRAIVHTIIREGYESALLGASGNDGVNENNVKDKLIVSLVRLLAGTGWPTSVSLRAAVELEIDQRQDALKCLQDARKRKNDFHDMRDKLNAEPECLHDDTSGEHGKAHNDSGG